MQNKNTNNIFGHNCLLRAIAYQPIAGLTSELEVNDHPVTLEIKCGQHVEFLSRF
jgi:hypothetical protein